MSTYYSHINILGNLYGGATSGNLLSTNDVTQIENSIEDGVFEGLCPCPANPDRLCPCEGYTEILDFTSLEIVDKHGSILQIEQNQSQITSSDGRVIYGLGFYVAQLIPESRDSNLPPNKSYDFYIKRNGVILSFQITSGSQSDIDSK